MRILGILLIVLGIVGLVLATVFPILGIASIPGSITAILAGIGFLLLCCEDPCGD